TQLVRCTGGLHQAVVHPVAGKGLAGARFRLSQFVLMMRKHQVEAAAVDIERLTEVLHAHGGTFNMPAGPPRSPGTVPRRLPLARAFPECEVGRVAFAIVSFHTRAG